MRVAFKRIRLNDNVHALNQSATALRIHPDAQRCRSQAHCVPARLAPVVSETKPSILGHICAQPQNRLPDGDAGSVPFFRPA